MTRNPRKDSVAADYQGETTGGEPQRLCDDCNIIELEDRVLELELQVKQARAGVLDELAEPTIRASEEAEQNGDYVSQTCYEDVLKWIAAIRQQEGKP